MIVSFLVALIVLAGVGALVYRGVILRRGLSSVSLLVGSLLGALLLRSPTLGDRIIEQWVAERTGWYNMPDLLGHGLTFVAMGAVIAYAAQGSVRINRMVLIWGALGVLWAASAFVFFNRGAWKDATENVVLLPGMEPYSALFSIGLLVTHTVVLVVVGRSLHNFTGVDMWQKWFLGGASAGLLMAIHRLAVIFFAPLKDAFYLPVSWVLSLACIGGYVGACAFLGRAIRREQGL